jgi:hypothetical protein
VVGQFLSFSRLTVSELVGGPLTSRQLLGTGVMSRKHKGAPQPSECAWEGLNVLCQQLTVSCGTCPEPTNLWTGGSKGPTRPTLGRQGYPEFTPWVVWFLSANGWASGGLSVPRATTSTAANSRFTERRVVCRLRQCATRVVGGPCVWCWGVGRSLGRAFGGDASSFAYQRFFFSLGP